MKLFNKIGLISIGVFAISSTTILGITSCSSSNPYADYTTGATISIKSKKNANNCDTVAKNYINVLSPTAYTSET